MRWRRLPWWAAGKSPRLAASATRNGYAAGAIGAAPLRLAGWWDLKSQRWLEDGYQAGTDSGNMAWAMLALLTLSSASGDPGYRDGALSLARWVEGTLDTR